jgi:HAD superfamily hydrolase (TIGR01509 family)
MSLGVPACLPIEGVVFDLHHTLIDPGEPELWLDLAWRHLRRAGSPRDTLGPRRLDEICDVLDRIWERAHEIDPASRRDLDSATHQQVFRTVLSQVSGLDEELSAALYATLLDTWTPYDDTLPVLEALHEKAWPVAVISNVGFNVRPVLDRVGITQLIAGVTLSFEVGVVKPDSAIFNHALDVIGVPADRTLMVGDNFRDDAAAAALGIRTLILPRTRSTTRGLASVIRLMG